MDTDGRDVHSYREDVDFPMIAQKYTSSDCVNIVIPLLDIISIAGAPTVQHRAIKKATEANPLLTCDGLL
jgi:hypothetical protein